MISGARIVGIDTIVSALHNYHLHTVTTQMMKPLLPDAQAQLFTQARTHSTWHSRDVPDDLLRELYELMRWGPSSANSNPARLVFVKSAEAKAKLLSCVSPGNYEKTRSAPVTVIIGMDLAFYDKLPRLFPHDLSARSWFADCPELIYATAFRNSSLQGAYMMLAARLLGLDCGPMSGFDSAKLDEAFFMGTAVKSNFICNLGYGNQTGLLPRSPRLGFDEACAIA
jgi:3-hydroxypropanoate dehydrogenase